MIIRRVRIRSMNGMFSNKTSNVLTSGNIRHKQNDLTSTAITASTPLKSNNRSQFPTTTAGIFY